MSLPLVLTALAGASLAPLGDLYVDQSAASCATGTGTIADPVCSIPDAIALATAGDTIHIAPGVYVGNVFLPFDLELIGTAGQEVTILDAEQSGTVVTIPSNVTGTLDGLTMRNGFGSQIGGGIRADGNLTLRNSTVTENDTQGYVGLYLGGAGIGALSGGSTVVIEQCSITNNQSDKGGAGVAIYAGDLTIRNSTIARNQNFFNAYRGAGVLSLSSVTRITNTTISGNAAQNGSGLYVGSALPGSGVWSSTIVKNLGDTPGIHLDQSSFFELGNSLVANYPYRSPSPQDITGGLTSVGHNLVSSGGPGLVNGVNGDLVGTLMTPIEPHLLELGDHGGLTETHALILGSPAIDAGNPMSFQPTDQRGISRPDGPAPDIGAFEGANADINLCNGDGGDQAGCTDCPCGNNATTGTIGGCLNFVGSSARLFRSGDTSVSLPYLSPGDLRFSLNGAPPATLCVLSSGEAVAPTGMGNPCFGLNTGVPSMSFNGLRCAAVNIRRHGGRQANSQGTVGIPGNAWGGIYEPNEGIAQSAGVFTSGVTRYFQVIYRETPTVTCAVGLNTTQAIEVTFTP